MSESATAPPPTTDGDVKMEETKPEVRAEETKSQPKPETNGSKITAPLSAEAMKDLGMSVPEDDDAMDSHDLTVPKVEGKSEEEVVEALEKAAKQGERIEANHHAVLC